MLFQLGFHIAVCGCSTKGCTVQYNIVGVTNMPVYSGVQKRVEMPGWWHGAPAMKSLQAGHPWTHVRILHGKLRTLL